MFTLERDKKSQTNGLNSYLRNQEKEEQNKPQTKETEGNKDGSSNQLNWKQKNNGEKSMKQKAGSSEKSQ